MKTLGLCMIVKNEARVVERCLKSVRGLIDYALVVDTGSTDGTQRIIQKYLAAEALPGMVIEEPWRDFAYNRSIALEKLRERTEIDYALVIDADDILVFDKRFNPVRFRSDLDKDFYHLEIQAGPIRLWRPQILSNRVAFSYKGVVYEFIAAPGTASAGVVSGFHIQAGTDGFRSGNPNRFREDASTLERALAEPVEAFTQARYTFYLAQNLMNAGEKEKALQTYLRRSELGLWNQEVSLSLYHAAQLKHALAYPVSDVIGTFLRAYEVDPTRAEPLHGAMDYCRRTGNHHQAYLIGKQALSIPEPVGSLAVASWIYDYGLLEEFSVAAYRSGHYKDSVNALEKLLSEKKIPKSARPRLHSNERSAAARLAGSKSTPDHDVSTAGLPSAT